MEKNKKVLFDSDNIRFNFAHVINHVLKKWLLILVGTVVGTIIVTASLYVLSTMNVDKELVQEAIDEKEATLSNLEKNYELEKIYSEKSIIMQIQSKAVHVNQLQFNVETTDEYLASAMNAFLNYVKNGGLFTDVCEEIKTLEPKYLQEILIVNYTNSTVTKESSVFDINIVGTSKEMCEEIAIAIENNLAKYSTNLKAVGITNQIKKIDSSYYIGKDDSYSNLQDAEKETLKKMKKQIVTLKEEIEATYDSLTISTKKLVIFVALGVIASAFVMVVIILMKYIFNKNIKYAREIEDAIGIAMLGENISNKEEIILAKSRIKAVCDLNDIADIALVGLPGEEKVGELITELSNVGISCKYIGDIVGDASGIAAMEKELKVVWLVSSEDTSYTYLNVLGNCCEQMKTHVLGYVYM